VGEGKKKKIKKKEKKERIKCTNNGQYEKFSGSYILSEQPLQQ